MEARTEGRAEGRAEGINVGRNQEIFQSVQDKDYTIQRGAEKLSMSVEEFINLMKKEGFTIPEE